MARTVQACLQLDQMARPTAKECFAIIKRSLREGSDEPHSVGSGVPSVVVRHDAAECVIILQRAMSLTC